MTNCLFCKIVAGDIPAQIIARNEHALAFLDVDPLADGHTLVVPTHHATLVEELTPAAAAGLFAFVAQLAGPVRLAVGAAGSTIGINNGAATGQTVPHVHVHLVPRWDEDGAGSIHMLFQRRSRQPIGTIAERIRRQLGE